MKLTLLTGAAVAAIATASGAFAQDSGWYGAVDIGGHHQTGLETAFPPLAGDADGFNFRVRDVEIAGFVRLGYRLSPHFRLELEGGFRNGGIQSINDFKTPDTPSPDGADIDLCSTGSV